MDLEFDYYYHLYNRSVNQELLFRNEENYIFFLKKYRFYLDDYFNTLSYCLMPTHFHLVVKVVHRDISEIKSKIGVLLRSYARAYNKRYNRSGALIQQKTKSKLVESDNYLINLISYVHQNPVR